MGDELEEDFVGGGEPEELDGLVGDESEEEGEAPIWEDDEE